MIMKVTKTNRILGDIYISGSKNAALPCICCALLTKQKVILQNIPDIEDVRNLLIIIKKLGVKVKRQNNEIILSSKHLKSEVMNEVVSKLRGSYYLMGVLLARTSKVRMLYPGGCNLGERPIDYHLSGFEQLGFKVTKEKEFIEIKAEQKEGGIVTFPDISLGATINVIFAAVLLKGITIINNPSLEPEVLCVINMLTKMGANIKVEDQQVIIVGVKKLTGTTHQNIYDRIEAGSYMLLAGVVPNSRVVLHNANLEHLELIITVLRKMGIKITKNQDSLVVEGTNKIHKANILIGPYPFFPTDLQQILTVVLTKASGTSTIEDPVFPSRIAHLKELRKMGAYVYEDKGIIYIKESKIKSAKVQATDLRCAFGLIVAGAIANGNTYIKDIDYLFRGYEKPIEKLKAIGINVQII